MSIEVLPTACRERPLKPVTQVCALPRPWRKVRARGRQYAAKEPSGPCLASPVQEGSYKWEAVCCEEQGIEQQSRPHRQVPAAPRRDAGDAIQCRSRQHIEADGTQVIMHRI